MILVKAPLRISLVGGATDVPEFYKKFGGAVVSFSIDKHIYVLINKKFDHGVRVSYSVTENVDEPEQLKHDIVREALKLTNTRSLEIVSVADIPGSGSGLGSSSTFSVAITMGIRAYQGKTLNRHPGVFAETAYHIERDLCEHPVGKQDHYASAYGGINFFEFQKDDKVITVPIRLTDKKLHEMEDHFMLFWLGKTRDANKILRTQARNFSNEDTVWLGNRMKDNAYNLAERLQNNNIDGIGDYLHNNWLLKRQLAEGISNRRIDNIYGKAIQAGASGGKLSGAGGSGFLFFYADPDKHKDIEKAVDLRRVDVKVSKKGASVICHE